MDSIEIYRCAIGFGIKVQQPSDVTDAHMVEMANAKVLVAAHGILQDCYMRTYDPALPHADQHEVVRLIGDLGYGRASIADVQSRIYFDVLLEGIDFAKEDRSEALGAAYSEYLRDCFNETKAVFDPQGDDQGDELDWLGLAFNLRLAKNAGRRIDPEGDVDKADGVARIVDTLSSGCLEKGVNRYMSGKSTELPNCIERLIVLKGYPEARELLPAKRKRLASFIAGEIERLQGTDHWREAVAANIFAKCSDACLEQVDTLLTRLMQRRETLLSYGTGSIRKTNKSGNATGIQRIHRTNKKKLPDVENSEPDSAAQLEAEFSLLLEMPVIGDAVRLIDSPDVNNETGKALAKLEKRPPTDTEHMWPDLWKRFHKALAKVAEQKNVNK